MTPVTTMPRADLARLCAIHAGLLDLRGCVGPDGQQLDAARLLWAMSGRESTFGKNMVPRHEPAYDVGGLYWRNSAKVKQGVALYGRDFACSYGPLQVLAVNAGDHTPQQLGADPELALAVACAFLQSYAIDHFKAKTLSEICQCWNGGHIGATTTPGYVDEVTGYYAAGLPADLNP